MEKFKTSIERMFLVLKIIIMKNDKWIVNFDLYSLHLYLNCLNFIFIHLWWRKDGIGVSVLFIVILLLDLANSITFCVLFILRG